jgi:nicotinamidase-related amidase
MTVIRFPRNDGSYDMPIIVFVDLQREYVTQGRAHALDRREPWWTNCQRLLEFARERSLPVAHFRQVRREPFFNRATPFADWIEEFRPRPHEMVFERAQPSCYSNESFAELLDSLAQPCFLLVGLTGESSCLATIMESYHRGHSVALVADASDSRPLGGYGESDVHGVVIEIAAQFGDVVTTSEVISRHVGRKPSLAG